MRPREALLRVLCKLGFHTTRVTGHTDEEKPEYYYTCVFCDDGGFWDYAVPDRAILQAEKDFAEGNYSKWVPL
jgi:hypothetical protein